MTIVLYDIPSTAPGCAWAANTWKVRYCLNFKQIPYRTEWVEYPDIQSHCKSLAIPPTGKRPIDGEPTYSLPAIYDPSTGQYISDSFLIIEYLEKTHPESPSVFPNKSHGLQAAFLAAFYTTTKYDHANEFVVLEELAVLNPVSQEYFRRTREKGWGKKLEEIGPQGEEATRKWAKFKDAMGKIDSWYAKGDGQASNASPFLMGSTVSWADFVVGAKMLSMKILLGEESEKWRDISSWHGGRWKALVDSLQIYATVL